MLDGILSRAERFEILLTMSGDSSLVVLKGAIISVATIATGQR